MSHCLEDEVSHVNVTGVMAYSVEKLLSDAATLVSRLKEHDTIADILISQTGNLHKRMEAMKEVGNLRKPHVKGSVFTCSEIVTCDIGFFTCVNKKCFIIGLVF